MCWFKLVAKRALFGENSHKAKVSEILSSRTLAFSQEKVELPPMPETRKFNLLGPCQPEAPT